MRLNLREVSASGTGFFANAGYEFRWQSGFGILLGAGVAHLATMSATNGIDTISASGGTYFNLEVGARFMFL